MTLEEICQRVEAVYRQAENAYGRSFDRPQVSCALRGIKAGTAHPGRNQLRFNQVLAVENPQAFHAEVIPHEVAHLVAFSLYGTAIRPHGREWQAVMNTLGVTAKTTHQLDVSNARARRIARPYRYACACQTHALTAIRHRRAQQGVGYRCRRCRGALVLVGEPVAD